MTETQASTEAAVTDPPAEGAEAPQTPPEGAAERARREAASYRERLRSTETERDGLRERLGSYERTEVERLAADRGLAEPADLWVVLQLDDLRDDDGALDAEKIRTGVDELLKARPHWRRAQPDLGAGVRDNGTARQPGLADLLGKGR